MEKGESYTIKKESPEEEEEEEEITCKQEHVGGESPTINPDPCYLIQPRLWWRERFADIAATKEDMDLVAVLVYQERKALCPAECRNYFFYHQVARELVDMTRDKEMPLLWRGAFLNLCNCLSLLSLNWEKKMQADMEPVVDVDKNDGENYYENDTGEGNNKRIKLEDQLELEQFDEKENGGNSNSPL